MVVNRSVTELKGMCGKASKTVLIEVMTRAPKAMRRVAVPGTEDKIFGSATLQLL